MGWQFKEASVTLSAAEWQRVCDLLGYAAEDSGEAGDTKEALYFDYLRDKIRAQASDQVQKPRL